MMNPQYPLNNMAEDAMQPGMVHLWPTVNPISDLEDLHKSHGRLIQIHTLTRTNPKQIPRICALEPHQVRWVTDRPVNDAIRPTLENLYSTIDRNISSDRGILWFEGIELLVRVNGFDAVLKFVRSIVDISQKSDIQDLPWLNAREQRRGMDASFFHTLLVYNIFFYLQYFRHLLFRWLY